MKPRVLLLDEPLSALDRKMRETMQIELKNLQHSVGITFIFVTHDQEEALAMSDRIAVLSHGKVQQLGSPTDVYDTPANEFVANFVGTSNLFSGLVVENDAGRGLVTIETANGRRLIARGRDYAKGSAVKMVIRPEHLRLVESEECEGAGTLDGRVKDVIFVGSVIHVHVDVGFGRTAIVHHHHDRAGIRNAIDVGASVRIAYSPYSAHLIAAERG